jgi:hypothetical protein
MKKPMPCMARAIRSYMRASAVAAQGVDWQDVNVVIESVKTLKKPSNYLDAKP